MNHFVTALRSGKVLLMDGAMGTEILRLLRTPVVEFEQINLNQRELILAIHRSYLDAGADVLLTNTFQTNPVVLWRRGLGKIHHEIWQAAIDLVHLDHPRPHYTLADVGPIENLTPKIVATILEECVGVDGILLETWSSLEALMRFVDRPSARSCCRCWFPSPSIARAI